jgi:glycosyltransferase involved in cell wall biosynthesis
MKKDLIDDHFGRFREIPLELARMGHRVTGLCLSYSPRTEGWISDGPVQWKSINAGRFKLVGLARFIAKARKMAKDADIIWACSDSFYGVIAHFLSITCHKPFIFDLYDNFEYYLAANLPIIRQLYRAAVRKCAAITCISRPLTDLLTTYGKHHGVFVLENAVRKDLFKPLDQNACRKDLGLPENCRLLGTAGAIHRNRGIDMLFEAFVQLKVSYPELHLAVAGPRDMPIPQDPCIHDLGVLPLEKVPLFLNALDVAVICVKDDAFGRYCYPQKVVEIMACDVPLVAANVGSLKEIFADSPNWLFEPGNIDSLEMAIKNRLHDRRTDYKNSPTWNDMAKVFDSVMIYVLKNCQVNAPNDRE